MGQSTPPPACGLSATPFAVTSQLSATPQATRSLPSTAPEASSGDSAAGPLEGEEPGHLTRTAYWRPSCRREIKLRPLYRKHMALRDTTPGRTLYFTTVLRASLTRQEAADLHARQQGYRCVCLSLVHFQ